ncbi:MAG TPA: MaoC family dehydratase [Aestuariivirgaceae bacterium]
MKGLFYEEVELGSEDTLGSYHFTRDAVLRFARAFDPQPFHLDDEAARQSHFGALCASGWHTAAAWMKCYVEFNERHRSERAARGERLPATGPSPGFENLKWLKPVYPGDTITYSSRMTGKRTLKSRPGWGLLLSLNTGINQAGDLVISFDGKVLIQMRE